MMKISAYRKIFLHDMQITGTCSHPWAAAYRCFISVFDESSKFFKEFFPRTLYTPRMPGMPKARQCRHAVLRKERARQAEPSQNETTAAEATVVSS